jgi:hypothetical protein
MGLRPETVLETADRPATPMIDGRRLGSCNPNGFGIQPYSGGAVSMNGTVIANVTMNNNGASGLLLHGDASNVELKNLITTNHVWNGNSSWGIQFYPAPSGAASGSVLDHVLYYNDYTNRSHTPRRLDDLKRADRRPTLRERRRRRPAPAHRLTRAWLNGYRVQPSG